jgi:hypothetical protein
MTNSFLRTNTFQFQLPVLLSGILRSRNSGSKSLLLLVGFLFMSVCSFAQETTVRASVDSTSIKIGEQLSYKITVETIPGNLVVFPEGQTFNPMEVVESLSADTINVKNRFRLIKEYFLTQFDSGAYTIPRQRILIANTPFFTDSLRVEVANVGVDTTKQKMYSIKPAMEVPGSISLPVWLWWIIGMLLIGGFIFYLLRRRKKKQEAQKQLPPYERALFELQELDKSHLLEKRETKEYYSKLTGAVRRYLEDEVNLRAMESTTSELIHDLEVKMENGELKLSRQTIEDLKTILQRADLAKFANSRPDIITAKGDRSKIEHVIIDTKAAIPEPTEEELLKDEEYRQEQLRRKNRRRVITAVVAGVAVIAIAATVLVTTQGFSSLRNLVFGNPSKELLQGEWISSEYGEPEITISTPRVLKRGEIDMTPEARAMMAGNETFTDGDLNEELYVVLSTVRFQKGVEFKLETAVEGIYSNLEQKGARNIIVKDEEFTTLGGAKGIKVFGTLEMVEKNSKNVESKEYMILNFAENGGFQQVTVIFDEEDKYAEEIAGRIINSVEFENTQN